MTADEVEAFILSRYAGVKLKYAYAERSLFYNPNNILPNGVYFVTIKEKDGQNDKSSQLNRVGVFRVSFPLTPNKYQHFFGKKPLRARKGEIVDLEVDFSCLGEFTSVYFHNLPQFSVFSLLTLYEKTNN